MSGILSKIRSDKAPAESAVVEPKLVTSMSAMALLVRPVAQLETTPGYCSESNTRIQAETSGGSNAIPEKEI